MELLVNKYKEKIKIQYPLREVEAIQVFNNKDSLKQIALFCNKELSKFIRYPSILGVYSPRVFYNYLIVGNLIDKEKSPYNFLRVLDRESGKEITHDYMFQDLFEGDYLVKSEKGNYFIYLKEDFEKDYDNIRISSKH